MGLGKNYPHNCVGEKRRERKRERTHTHQTYFLHKRHIEVQDRCGIRFWYMIQGENITTEGTCLSHDIKKNSVTLKVRFYFIKEIADVFFTGENSICYDCILCEKMEGCSK